MSATDILRFDGDALRDSGGHEAEWPTVGVIGRPIAHSSSPRMHRAAITASGLEASYSAIEVSAEHLVAFVRAAASNMVGMNLTLPHKESVIECCAQISAEAREIGAVNTLVRRRDRWHGHNTDARGLALALQAWRGRSLDRALGKVVVIGSGGAARAAVACARGLGARQIIVLARRPEGARWAAELDIEVGSIVPELLRAATLVIQATPLGLHPSSEPSPIDLSQLPSQALAVDLTYASRPSAFMVEAEQRGASTRNGIGMLVGQAALSFSMWFGMQPPLEVMAESIGFEM